jgi:hypothetical protein
MNKPGILVKSKEQWFAEIPGLPLMMANRVALGADPFLISLEWIKTLSLLRVAVGDSIVLAESTPLGSRLPNAFIAGYDALE